MEGVRMVLSLQAEGVLKRGYPRLYKYQSCQYLYMGWKLLGRSLSYTKWMKAQKLLLGKTLGQGHGHCVVRVVKGRHGTMDPDVEG